MQIFYGSAGKKVALAVLAIPMALFNIRAASMREIFGTIKTLGNLKQYGATQTKHRTKRKFSPKYIRINSKQMNRC